jgi:hypothetical protein
VEPGFNSGWGQVMGIWERGGGDPREDESTIASEQPEGLVDFDGRGHYHSPQLTWLYTVGPTAIKFLDSDKYGVDYENDMFVGDVHAGNMYHFKLNQDRTELLLEPPLDDKVADTDEESVSDSVLFATGFGGISDIEVSPYDGYLYVVSLGQGKIFKILPTSEGDISAGAIPSPPPTPDVISPPVVDDEEDDSEEQDIAEQDDDNDDVSDDENDDDDNDNDNGNSDEDQDEDED